MSINYQHLYDSLHKFLPVYIITFLVLEFVYHYFFRRKINTKEVLYNVQSGIIVLVTQFFLQTFFLAGLYPSIYEHRVYTFSNGVSTLVIGFFLYTFLQYVSHYLSHKVRLFWCFHEVHHSATQMNSSTGLRNSIFDIMSTDALYLFIPFVGIPPIVFLINYALAKIWGNFIHINEDIVSRISWLRWFVVDPETHHLHHAKNKVYLDKNFCEVTPLYDKLFGTYVEQSEVPKYGSLHHEPANFLDIHLYEFRRLKKDITAASSFKVKVMLVFMPPGWKNTEEQNQEEELHPHMLEIGASY
jgi:sterol desaturase/sphingolipid hydroxylase (fatty acid hydroxylase superfamily)